MEDYTRDRGLKGYKDQIAKDSGSATGHGNAITLDDLRRGMLKEYKYTYRGLETPGGQVLTEDQMLRVLSTDRVAVTSLSYQEQQLYNKIEEHNKGIITGSFNNRDQWKKNTGAIE